MATPEEKGNPELLWNLPDERFFAEGACHILAWTYLKENPGQDLTMVYIRPKRGKRGHHVYVRGTARQPLDQPLGGQQINFSFDWRGLLAERGMLNHHLGIFGLSDGDIDLIPVHQHLDEFCAWSNHRPPSYFLELPWRRALRYIAMLENREQEPANPIERQRIWNARVTAHLKSCPVCRKDGAECETWDQLVYWCNAAAPLYLYNPPEEEQ